MIMSADGWLEWQLNATDDEKYLVERAFELDEDLFKDMIFQSGSSTYSLIACKSKSIDDNEWRDDEAPIPDKLLDFSLTWFHWKVCPVDAIDGYAYYDHSEQTLCVSHEHLHEDSCILHELIHLHEAVINELPLYFHDMIFWALYQVLKLKIPKLDEIITTHAHALNEYDIYRSGGLHDILFLLKSFDLDIKMNYPLGTVFSYGYKSDLAEYKYIAGSDYADRTNTTKPQAGHNNLYSARKDENGNWFFQSHENMNSKTIQIPVGKLEHPIEHKSSPPIKFIKIEKKDT